jgi:hypothetical protein
MVKLYVVSCVAPDSVPVIAPVLVFKLAPPGKDPEAIEYAVALVALTVKLIVPPASTVPKDPAAVCHAGASDTVSIAVELRTALPSGFSTRIKYVPSTGNVKFVTNVVALEKETESAV